MAGATSSTGWSKERWRDIVRQNLKDIGIEEDKWFDEAVTSRDDWRSLYRRIKTNATSSKQCTEIQCPICLRFFSSESDRRESDRRDINALQKGINLFTYRRELFNV